MLYIWLNTLSIPDIWPFLPEIQKVLISTPLNPFSPICTSINLHLHVICFKLGDGSIGPIELLCLVSFKRSKTLWTASTSTILWVNRLYSYVCYGWNPYIIIFLTVGFFFPLILTVQGEMLSSLWIYQLSWTLKHQLYGHIKKKKKGQILRQCLFAFLCFTFGDPPRGRGGLN